MNKRVILIVIVVLGVVMGRTTVYRTVSLMPQLELVIVSGDGQICEVGTPPSEELIMKIQYVGGQLTKESKSILPSIPLDVEVIDPDGATIENTTINTEAGTGIGIYSVSPMNEPGTYTYRFNTTLPEFAGRNLIVYRVDFYEVKVKNGIIEVPEGSYDKANIKPTPEMPNLNVSIENSDKLTGNVQYSMNVHFEMETQNHTENFPASGYVTIPVNEVWDVDFGTTFRGGTTTVNYLIESENKSGQIVFDIRGENPLESAVKDYVGTDPWFLTRLIRAESSYKQFNPDIPYFGAPNGWGLMMPDPPGDTEPECQQRMWGWKDNCDYGQFILNQKLSEIQLYWKRQAEIVDIWNSSHPENKVSEQPITYNGITFNYPVKEGEKSFHDAVWIKFYNGTGVEKLHFTGVLFPPDDGNPDTIEIPYWSHHESATVDGEIKYYVRYVCSLDD